MPIFEYKCASCGTVSEFLVGVARETESIRCTSCGSKAMRKVFSTVNHAAKTPVGQSCSSCPAHEHARHDSCCESMGCPKAV